MMPEWLNQVRNMIQQFGFGDDQNRRQRRSLGYRPFGDIGEDMGSKNTPSEWINQLIMSNLFGGA